MKHYMTAASLLVSLLLLPVNAPQAQARSAVATVSHSDRLQVESPRILAQASATVDPAQRQAEYLQLKNQFQASLKGITHIMMGGPATKDTIELKDALRQILRLEERYNDAKLSGADSQVLAAYGAQYIRLLQIVAERHQSLLERVEPLIRQSRETAEAMTANYSDLEQADEAELEQMADDTDEALEPVLLGAERLQEAADAGIVVTYKVVPEESQAAAVRILDARTSKPHDQF